MVNMTGTHLKGIVPSIAEGCATLPYFRMGKCDGALTAKSLYYSMSGLLESDFSPLLQPGFHLSSLPGLETMCVDAFNPKSTTRENIMEGLKQVLNQLASVSLQCDVWVDGGFLTEKINPKDSDIVIRASGPYVESASQSIKDVVKWLGTDLKPKFLCHCFFLPVYPVGHQLYDFARNSDAYWKGQFGFSRANNPKGIAVIKLCGGVQ